MPLDRRPQDLIEIELPSQADRARKGELHQRAGSARARRTTLIKMGATGHLCSPQIGHLRRCMTMASGVINSPWFESFFERVIYGNTGAKYNTNAAGDFCA